MPMSKAAFSLRVFSLYMFVLGLILILDPNLLLRVFEIPQTREIWIRIVGMLVLILGYYDFMASRTEDATLFRWSVHVRLFAAVLLIIFVVSGVAPAVLILFGSIDAAAAAWTALSLKQDPSKAKLRR
jgi:hypothetical protein